MPTSITTGKNTLFIVYSCPEFIEGLSKDDPIHKHGVVKQHAVDCNNEAQRRIACGIKQ
jgi:hypothetical protein